MPSEFSPTPIGEPRGGVSGDAAADAAPGARPGAAPTPTGSTLTEVEPSREIAHYVCCRIFDQPTAVAFCGQQSGPNLARTEEQDCVVCDDLFASLGPGFCIYGGVCPEDDE